MPRGKKPQPLHILCAPGAFKECMSAPEAAAAMARGVQRAAKSLGVEIEATEHPLSDGGNGFLESLLAAGGWEVNTVDVDSATGEVTSAPFLMRDRKPSIATRILRTMAMLVVLLIAWFIVATIGAFAPFVLFLGIGVIFVLAALVVLANPKERQAAVEVATAIGLNLVPHDLRDPTRLTTRGVGQLINAARVRGAQRIIVGVGNTSTVDGGVGMAAELGHEFFDDTEHLIESPVGADLSRIDSYGLSSRWRYDSTDPLLKVIAACDVENELTGRDGAARVFGPQKGATPEQVAELDRALRRFSRLFEDDTDVSFTEGTHTGAGGGLGFGLAAFCNADLEPGAKFVMLETGFWHKISRADLVLTGEGRIDAQTVRGKLPIAVSKEARDAGVPTIALVGSVGEGAERCLDPGHATTPGGETEGGLLDYLVITPEGMPLDEALRRGPELLEAAAERAVRNWVARRPAGI